jgi:hypothetical protein
MGAGYALFTLVGIVGEVDINARLTSRLRSPGRGMSDLSPRRVVSIDEYAAEFADKSLCEPVHRAILEYHALSGASAIAAV